MFCTQPTISSSLIVHSTNIFLTIKLGTFLIFYQTLLLHLSVYTGGSVGGAPNAQKAFVQTVLGFCMAPKCKTKCIPYLLKERALRPMKLCNNDFPWVNSGKHLGTNLNGNVELLSYPKVQL